MTKAAKNAKNAAILRCDICKTGLMGQDSFDSHVRGKKHEQRVAQRKYADRNKIIEEEEEALASRGSSKGRPQSGWESEKATPDPRSAPAAARSSYPEAPRAPVPTKASRARIRDSGGRIDEIESQPSREAQRFSNIGNSGQSEGRRAHIDEAMPQSFRQYKPDVARLDPRERRSYRSNDSSAVQTSKETGFRGSGVAERSGVYRPQYDDRRTPSTRQKEDPRRVTDPRLNIGPRHSDDRHLSTEMPSSGSFPVQGTTSHGEFREQALHHGPPVPAIGNEMRPLARGYLPLPDSVDMDTSELVSPSLSTQLPSSSSSSFQKNEFPTSDANVRGYPVHDMTAGGAHGRRGQSSALRAASEYGGSPAELVDPSYVIMQDQDSPFQGQSAFVVRHDNPLSAQDSWLDEPMSVDEWRAMEDKFMEVGGDHALAFKILRESLLNPHVGIEEHDMDTCKEIFSRIPVIYQGANLWSANAADAPRCTIFERGEQSVSSQEEVDALQRLGTLIRSHLDPFHRDAAEEARLFEERSSDEREAEYQASFDAKLEESNRQGGFVAGQTAIVLYSMSIGAHVPGNLFHPKSVVCDPTFLALQSPGVKDLILNKIARSR